MPELIAHVDSLDIFPVSWCETNGYPLLYPIKPEGGRPKIGSLCVPLSNLKGCHATVLILQSQYLTVLCMVSVVFMVIIHCLTVEKQRRIAVVQPEKQ